MLAAAERLARGLWVGLLFTTGYLVAPVLFSVLEDRALAGRLAGAMFSVATLASLALAVFLGAVYAGGGRTARPRLLLALSIVLILAANEWGLRPFMEAVRGADGTPGPGFAVLHGVSAVLWLLATGLAAWLAALGEGVFSGRGG